MLHYAPQHVSSSTLLIIRRTNCITTASGIVTLCKQPYSMQVESGLQYGTSLSIMVQKFYAFNTYINTVITISCVCVCVCVCERERDLFQFWGKMDKNNALFVKTYGVEGSRNGDDDRKVCVRIAGICVYN